MDAIAQLDPQPDFIIYTGNHVISLAQCQSVSNTLLPQNDFRTEIIELLQGELINVIIMHIPSKGSN